jgi:hypothetical protein
MNLSPTIYYLLLGGYGRLLSIDRDPDAIDSALRRFKSHLKSDLFESRFTASLCDFKQLPAELLNKQSLISKEMPKDNLGCHGIVSVCLIDCSLVWFGLV